LRAVKLDGEGDEAHIGLILAASPIHPKWFSVRLLSMRLPMIWQIMYTGMHGAHSQLTGM
jgi:hypothetical protein